MTNHGQFDFAELYRAYCRFTDDQREAELKSHHPRNHQWVYEVYRTQSEDEFRHIWDRLPEADRRAYAAELFAGFEATVAAGTKEAEHWLRETLRRRDDSTRSNIR